MNGKVTDHTFGNDEDSSVSSDTATSGKIMKGRGAISNLPGRFEQRISVMEEEFLPQQLETLFFTEHAKSMITRNQSPDVSFQYSLNPYRGCEHGCIYCFARPNHAYVDLSPGLDFETRIFVKENAAKVLRQDLAKPSYQPSPICIGTATDPYQPIEAQKRITRQVLQVLWECRHPCSLITKSQMVCDDIDLLAQMAQRNLVRVMVSLTTLDNDTKRRLEPRTASGEARVRVIEKLTRAGVPVGVLMAPLIPWINDHEVETMLGRVAEAGAESAAFILLRLPREVEPLFVEWLHAHYPERADKVLNTLRSARQGRLNDPRFGSRMRGEGEFAELFSQRFQLACRKAGVGYHRRVELDCSQFVKPSRSNQLALF